MNSPKRFWLNNHALTIALAATGLLSLASCAPIDGTPRPTLNEVRSGSARGQITEDIRLRPSEVTVSPRTDVVEGTVERINYDRGVFDIRPRSGRTVNVLIPYNARAADVDNFRSLRRGDHVRVEGEFVNPESFQLFAFLSPR